MPAAPLTAHTSVSGSHTYRGTDVLVHPTPYSTVMPVVPLTSSGAHLPVGSLLQAYTIQTPSTRATMNSKITMF